MSGLPNPSPREPVFPVRLPVGDTGAHVAHTGMYLRDWFAGQALAGMDIDGGSPEASARWAYRVADAMLAERAKAEGQS